MDTITGDRVGLLHRNTLPDGCDGFEGSGADYMDRAHTVHHDHQTMFYGHDEDTHQMNKGKAR